MAEHNDQQKDRNDYEYIEPITVAVDCIIFGFNGQDLELLMIPRGFEPEMGRWSLMGGFIQRKESVDDAARRVLHKLTGLEDIYMEQLSVFGAVHRDPGDRVISITYFALIRKDSYDKALVDAYKARWFSLNMLPALIFDHKEMVEASIKQLRKKVKIEPIGFNLLPKKFTLPQLQVLYEAILGYSLDKRNFRKKIEGLSILKKLNEKQKETSKKGAFLYTFDENYKEQEGGFNI